MADSRESTLLKLVNATGFVFQLGIENMIEAEFRKNRHGWQVVGREHRWVDPTSEAEGFIDIVLQQELWRMGIECKRLGDDTSWAFLVTEPTVRNVRSARLLWTSRLGDGMRDLVEWDDFLVEPLSPQSAFCVVWGQSDKDKPMLERLSDRVLSSLEGLAHEEFQLKGYGGLEWRIYVPVIVTTARLEVCTFDPGEVDIDTGKLPSGNFEAVPFIRFRKGLATRLSASKAPKDLEEANREKERTIFVVHATNLIEFLSNFNIAQPMRGRQWPWEVVWQALKIGRD